MIKPGKMWIMFDTIFCMTVGGVDCRGKSSLRVRVLRLGVAAAGGTAQQSTDWERVLYFCALWGCDNWLHC